VSVSLVGAGPGDPELLTLRALRTLQRADIVLYDRLVPKCILELARRDATFEDVGKVQGRKGMEQAAINARLVELAQRGLHVVRLKGGDPFVFGRGGEERDALREAGIETFVVPGVTAALGCAAASGAPLTHRDHAQAVTFVTGHARSGGAPELDWAALAAPKHTLVVYMGAANAPGVAAKLLAAGRDGAIPVLIVENGTRPDQRLIASRLDALARDCAILDPDKPALLIIGEVAALADSAQAAEYWAKASAA